MYNLTRQDVADMLNISTRSVDRYIKSWKLRSKKEWKVVYVNGDDVKNINSSSTQNWEVIMPEANQSVQKEVSIEKNTWWLTEIYKDLREEIRQKDKIIQELSVKVWQTEEILKNSVSMIDFKKSQFLLEESKWHLNTRLSDLSNKNTKLKEDLKHERTTNFILIVFILLLLSLAFFMFFVWV